MNLRLFSPFILRILMAEDFTLKEKSTYFLSTVKSSNMITGVLVKIPFSS